MNYRNAAGWRARGESSPDSAAVSELVAKMAEARQAVSDAEAETERTYRVKQAAEQQYLSLEHTLECVLLGAEDEL